MTRWLIRTAVSLAVVATLLIFIPIDAVLDALRRTSAMVWVTSLVIFMTGHVVNAVKLRLLLGHPRPPVIVCLQAHFAGQAANLSLPGAAGGDLVRAAYLTPAVGARRVALASVADRLIDTATVVLVILLALPFAGAPPALEGVVEQGGWWIAGIATAGLLAIGIVMWLRPHEGLARKMADVVSRMREYRGIIGAVALMSLSTQTVFVLLNVWLAREAGVTTSIAAFFVAWPMSKLVAILPISLGGIGVREAALVTLLAPYGAPREAVLASGILWQAILIVSGLVGLIITQAIRPSAASARSPESRSDVHS